PSEALVLFARSAALAPNWVAPVVALGDLFRSQGLAQEALVAYGRAAELTSNDAAIFIKRGNLLSEARDFDGAVEDYERAA
ncbi:MAG: tetratricopeptide repeat protein, partial [Pseudomonadota bacterium]|nr:tetratricopeptide repeat protein [Pseudomonadota bacterium]